MGAKSALAIFLALLAALVAVFAAVQGIGDPTVPSGDVAIVHGALASVSQISKEEFDLALRKAAEGRNLKQVPSPGDAEYAAVENEVLENLLPEIWLKSEARDRGIAITPKEFAKGMRANRREGPYTEDIYSRAEIRENVHQELIGEAIERELAARAARPTPAEVAAYYKAERAAKFAGRSLAESRAEIETILLGEHQTAQFHAFDLGFEAKWRPRTYCAAGYVIAQCGNYPGGRPAVTPPECTEADPRKPAKECPAPVLQAMPALPGSVTQLKPEGEPLPQRPRPE